MKRVIEIEQEKQIELAVDNFTQILIQQAMINRNNQINKKIKNKYGKSN
jgi:hypothetical protein